MTLSGRSGVRPSSSISSIWATLASWNSSTRRYRNWRCQRRRTFGPRPEQLGDGGDLLAEVERAAARELGLVRVIDAGELGQPERSRARRRRRRRSPRGRRCAGGSSAVDLAPVDGPAGAGDGPSGLAIGGLVGGVGVVGGCLAGGLGALAGADARRRRRGPRGAARGCPGSRAGRRRPRSCRSAPRRRARSLGDERVEVGGGDQLVLGPVDELHERARAPLGAVVDERRGRAGCPGAAGPGRRRRARRAAAAARRRPRSRSGSAGRSCGSC